MKTRSKILLLATFAALCGLAVPVLTAAPEPALPRDVTIKQLLADKPSARDWTTKEYSIKEEDGEVIITSDKGNPTVEYGRAFSLPVLVRARLQDVEKNHVVRMLLNGKPLLEFNRQFSTLQFGPDVEVTLGQMSKSQWIKAATRSTNFLLWVAITKDRLVVWIDKTRVCDAPFSVEGNRAKIGFNSGWKSDWVLSDFAVWSVDSLPDPK